MLHDVICVPEFVLFNNEVIFVLLFDKTVKLLLSSMTWVKETKDCLIPVLCCDNTKCSVRRLENKFHDKHWYLASISRLTKHMDN